MFGFIKKAFFRGLTILSSVNPLSEALSSAAPLSPAPLNVFQ